uniref:Uncharacterized protein n=1 Tax=Chrysemys picta bellii TaxID=8478 RepID=A0A8C3F0D1_CHRPI
NKGGGRECECQRLGDGGGPGKLRGQQTKSMKFLDGLIHNRNQPSGATARPHVLLRQGVLRIKAKIMLPRDPSGPPSTWADTSGAWYRDVPTLPVSE